MDDLDLNRGLLVPWAADKCQDCGTTLASVIDVQMHYCTPLQRSNTRDIDPAYGFGGTKR